MQNFSKMLVLISALGFIPVAFAYVDETKGTTTCYILKNDKIVQKSACSYTADIETDITNTMNEYTYTVPHYGKIKTVNDYGGGTNDENANVIYKTEVHTINDKPSKNFQRNPKNLKIYSEKELAKNSRLFKNSLYCNRTKDKKLEICTPDKGND